jgi:single-strand DNA-binding protein
MLNKVILIGRITNDLDVKKSQSGTEYLSFSLAINRRMNRDKTDFIPCTAFGKTAQVMAQYLSKGSMINIEGSMQQSTYNNKDGQKVSKINVIVERMNFIESKNQSNNRATTTVNVKKEFDKPVSVSNQSETEETELRALFDDMDFFNE